jgi:sugar phosphate isomerase/epimerase
LNGIGISVDDDDLDSLASSLDRCVAAGYAAAELSSSLGAVIRGGRVSAAALDRASRVLRGFPLRYTFHAPAELSLLRDRGLAAQVLDACLVMASDLGAEIVVYHSAQIALHDAAAGLASLPDEARLREAWRYETSALCSFAPRAQALGLLLVVENRDPHRWEVAALARSGKPSSDLATYHQGMRLDLLARQVAAIASPHLGLCLDVGHAFLAQPFLERQDYLGTIRQCAPWVKHVHLHDNFGRLDDVSVSLADRRVFGQADNHLPPGWGSIPLRQVMGILAEADYGGWLMVELEDPYNTYWPEALTSARDLWPAVDGVTAPRSQNLTSEEEGAGVAPSH